ncbi:MAG: hypothetical protein E7463_08735 [Ruminococcaceae bacterium]|nr:hypothetical protein [Oscillospiraceae bacterium]
MKIKDRFWLWGHPEGRYNHEYGNEQESRMTPMEGCLYLGISNTFMVPVGVNVNHRQYNKSFKTLKGVGWETYAAGKNPSVLEQYIEEARDFPNITRVVYDDFVRGGKFREIPLENLTKAHEMLHNNDVRPLDMWMVLYTQEFGLDPAFDEEFKDYIAPFDGIIMWTWKECDVPLIPEKYEIFKKLTPNNKRMFGCYLWNFGERKAATREAVLWQLDFYLDKIRKGEAEGVVFHTNTMADLDLDAYDAALEWMAIHGEEDI